MKTKKLLLSAFALLTISVNVFAQTTPAVKDTSWKTGGFMVLTVNQASLTNWAAGGQNALSISALANFFANYRNENTSWDNVLDIGYGLIKAGDDPFRKNEDKIEFNSKYGKKASGNFFYSGLLNFKTQLAPGYNYPNDSLEISRFAAPAFITIALGMDYKPNDALTVFLSPATGRLTLVADQKLADAGQFGVDKAEFDATGIKTKDGSMTRFEFGASLRVRYQKDVYKGINFLSQLNLFNNYTDKVAHQRANIDVDWQNMLNIKAGKLITFSVFAHLIYDNDITIPTLGDVTINGVTTKNAVIGNGPKTQFKNVLGVGISYKF